MIINYDSKKIKIICENEKIFIKKYGKSLYKNFQKQLKTLASKNVKNIQIAQRLYKGFKFKKLEGHKRTGRFKLNRSWRVNFTYKVDQFEMASEIFITRIHNHKY